MMDLDHAANVLRAFAKLRQEYHKNNGVSASKFVCGRDALDELLAAMHAMSQEGDTETQTYKHHAEAGAVRTLYGVPIFFDHTLDKDTRKAEGTFVRIGWRDHTVELDHAVRQACLQSSQDIARRVQLMLLDGDLTPEAAERLFHFIIEK